MSAKDFDHKTIKKTYTYDDIQLVPKYSEIDSRSKINLKTRLSRNFNIMIPFVASPMDTVCEVDMAIKILELGGVGCIHRFMTIEKQVEQTKNIREYIFENKEKLQLIWKENKIPIMVAVGANGDYQLRTQKLVEEGANVVLIDVAHGHHKNVKDAIEWMINLRINNKYNFDIIAGNISTYESAIDLCRWGADGLRVGIGGGCFTPNMKVKTKNGFKKIKNIKIGDEVYTHTGKLKSVINKFKYDNYDEIYNIDGIEVTANHKFYVVHKSKEKTVNATNIHYNAEWVSAENLSDDYFLVEL